MTASELDHQAATLAFAMLRFADGAAHPDRSSTPAGMLKTGTECYIFAPSPRPIAIKDVPQFLLDLPSPALLMPTTTRGIATLVLLGELTGDRLAWGRKTLTNQQQGLEMLTTQLNLPTDARVLLQFDDEEYWYPLDVLRRWVARFAVFVDWNLRIYEDDARAQARLMLHRSDGVTSWGDSFPIRRRST